MARIILRASAVAAYKACPTRYKYKYIERLVPDKEKEATRMGTSWHALMEVYRNTEAEETARLMGEIDRGGGDDMIPERAAEAAKDAAIDHLTERYESCPTLEDPESWSTEYIILLYSFIGYLWYWQNDDTETLAAEVGFDLPLHHPKVGMPLPLDEVVRHGTIDRIVRRSGVISVADYKSTSESIESDSPYWDHLGLDTQISMYVMALQELHEQGELRQYGVRDDEVVAGAFYDVWHKPKIKPKNITQKDTAELIETGTYCGSEFKVSHTEPTEGQDRTVVVDGTPAVVTEGKRGFAIRETPRMFGARLLADITERPTHYFARREIPRTKADITRFREQLYYAYQNIKHTTRTGFWMENERQCKATFHCPYIPICHHGVDVSDGCIPEGMKRETTPLTWEGNEI